ncbi:hypothetical protein BBF96_09630 [Anoxybacter fermentans]|uniref:UPF0297 protein BBF96_09630 n=1 Tax=Anoxybacter fermentans TaxID=1323375 RepID=A0A3Q9HR70_9FIRM|nr:IreB family regulatory phosphoprotein [Anoxybacter fermentans]AZR73625.1 hypothetical protein BBF96_09630 [Anoxybacter fermentans]
MNNNYKQDQTMMFKVKKDEEVSEVGRVLKQVFNALKEKGYNPINQIVGYILSGDPAYITSYKNARSLIRSLERDELIEELVRSYLEKNME